ncbi:MAG: flagellar basal body rod protein FlgB [Sedimentisphaerales bacterium]|nr:flagellar basal body rod protein FlgB [Sedimentisphaerales bacterium]
MILEGLLNRGTLPVLQQVMSFTEARQEVLVNNISNLDTVGYKVKDLPTEEFFSALRKAVRRRADGGAGALLEMRSTRHLRWDRNGRLRAEPAEIKNSNILFQDGNNRFVEKQMSDMSKNALLHNLTTELLRQQYGLLKTAISGRIL